MSVTEECFGESSITRDINIGDTVNLPTTIAGARRDNFIFIDNKISGLIERTASYYHSANLEKVGATMHRMNFAVDPQLMAFAMAFHKAQTELYPGISANFDTGRKKYFSSGETKILSDILENGVAACYEMSVLAAIAMKRVGLDHALINGEVNWGGYDEVEFTDGAHTFIFAKTNTARFIFDPANSQVVDNLRFPHISRIGNDLGRTADEWLEKGKSGKAFVLVEGVFDKKLNHYGFNDNTQIDLKTQCVNPLREDGKL